MKKFLFLLPFFALGACGDDEAKPEADDAKVVELKTFEDKLSYSFGVLDARKVTEARDENSGKLDRAMLLVGYKDGFKSGVRPGPEDPCIKTMESLFGAQGMDFNEAYLKEGSKCYGRFMAGQFFEQLESISEEGRLIKELLFKGFEDALAGVDIMMTQAEMEATIEEFSKQVQTKMMAEQAANEEQMAVEFVGNKTKGEEFLAANARKPGIITTASGLQYKVLKAGSGPVAKIGDQIAVHYTGTTLDDVKFDSSYDRNEPYPLTLPAQVITGWNEVLLLMKKGDKFEVYIPQELAYGATPRPGGPIEPFMVLKFEMEIMTLQAAPNGQF